MTTNTYNGYKNWTQWNVSLWLNNDEGLYNEMRTCVRMGHNRNDAVNMMMYSLNDMGMTHTPDGAKYSRTAVRAAMVGL